MTPGEIMALTHRATRGQRAKADGLAELYDELIEAKAKEAEQA